MSVWSRTPAVAAAGVMLVSLAGCMPGSGASEPTGSKNPPASSNALAGVDPCALLKPSDAEASGLRQPGSPDSEVSGEPGCKYKGQNLRANIFKNEKPVEEIAKTAQWARFDRVEINGRAGAVAINSGSTQAKICNIFFNAGSGSINVQSGEQFTPIDECAEGLKIAKLIEPNVPR